MGKSATIPEVNSGNTFNLTQPKPIPTQQPETEKVQPNLNSLLLQETKKSAPTNTTSFISFVNTSGYNSQPVHDGLITQD